MKTILHLSLLLLVSPVALFAATITGTVTDATTHKPAAGDDVILIALTQRMQEVARTKADAQGHYSINSPDDGMHLIRVDHQKAAYFQPAPPGTPHVDVRVYDVAATVPGITTEANVLRAETSPQGGLRITQSYFIKNDSTPPRTQFSPHSYEIYLPQGAQIQGAEAMGPGGMPVASSPIPLGDPNHYAFVFPLRPGETQFQLAYTLPYTGSLKVTPKLATPVDNLVVILPKSMSFSADGKAFQQVDTGDSGQDLGALTWVAKNVSPSHPPVFTIAGQGALPRDVKGGQNGAQGPGPDATAPANPEAGSAAARADTRPGGGLGNPLDSPDPLNKYKYWILSGLGLAIAVAAGFLLRRPVNPATASAAAKAGGSPQAAVAAVTEGNPPVLAALKEELFNLEADRMQGKLSESEYLEAKQALEIVLKRALAR